MLDLKNCYLKITIKIVVFPPLIFNMKVKFTIYCPQTPATTTSTTITSTTTSTVAPSNIDKLTQKPNKAQDKSDVGNDDLTDNDGLYSREQEKHQLHQAESKSQLPHPKQSMIPSPMPPNWRNKHPLPYPPPPPPRGRFNPLNGRPLRPPPPPPRYQIRPQGVPPHWHSNIQQQPRHLQNDPNLKGDQPPSPFNPQELVPKTSGSTLSSSLPSTSVYFFSLLTIITVRKYV